MIRVLLVDDHGNVRRTMGLVLEHEGMEVREAASAAEALEALERFPTDVVVTDVRLDRDMDGAVLLRAIKERDPDVEVILSQNLRESGLSAILSYRPRRNVELRGISRDNQDRAYSLRHEVTFGGGGRPAAAPAPPEPRVSAITVTGPRVDEAALASGLRLGAGDRFNFHTWQRDIDTLRERFHDEGRFEARVRATRQPDEAAGTVALAYRVDPGPRTAIVVEGYDLPARVRRELEQAWTRAIFDQFLAQDLDLRVRRHLLDREWVESRVQVDVDTSE
ncbi:MAG: response regulator, partial [Vicinamibacteria bacterium]